MTVLIVDDIAGNRKLLRAILETDGYEVTEAADGVEALALLEKDGADAIISDILMPRMDGFRLCNEIRSRERFRALPLIFYSSTFTSAADEELSLEVGADLCLKKPASREVILDAIRDVSRKPREVAMPLLRWGGAVMKEYSQTLVNNLEEKCTELEDAKAQLTKTNVELHRAVQIEEQHRQSQKMEAIGVLAGGVAHDFNNLLTVINGYAGILLEHPPAPGKARDMLRQIRLAGERAAALTRQLLAYSHKQILELTVVDLNELLTKMETMLVRLIEANIKLSVVAAPTPCWITADFHQIEQVVMNLVINARDAMPQGGMIITETGHLQIDRPLIDEYGIIPPGQYILLSVRDTGCGMSKETARRAFEPFFTTRETGKGTGLGLSTVYGIVKQSAGYIRLSSELGHGATFSIYLPSVKEQTRHASPKLETDELPRGVETILLVDDEQAIRELSRTIMEIAGYTVLEAADGKAALSLAAEHPCVDLLVTDVVMPGMGAGDLVEALLIQCPKMRILYLSGYTADAVLRLGVCEAQSAFLSKPFTPSRLTQKIREVLDAK